MGNKMVYVEQTENGTTSKKIVEVENKVLEVASSDTSLSALSTDTIETEITDGIISSEVKKGSVSSEYLSSDLQKKLGKETLPLKKLFLRDKLPTENDRIQTNKILKGGYDISRLSAFASNTQKDFDLETTFKCGGITNTKVYVKISVLASGRIFFVDKEGSYDIARQENREWKNIDFTKIQIQYDTEITQEQYSILMDYFDVLYDAEDIIVINRDEVGYDFTPMLISLKRRSHTYNYGGWYTAKSLFSRRKRIGYEDNGKEIPTRTTNMTLFDLLEWFGILSEENSDAIWYRKNEIKELNGSLLKGSDIFGFRSSLEKADCEKYYLIPLRSSSSLQLEMNIIDGTIANSDILGIVRKDEYYVGNEWSNIINISDRGYEKKSYTNFYVLMGIGKVERKFQEILRYSIQDICRVSVRMEFIGPGNYEDLSHDYIGSMIISFKGSVEK